MGAFVSTRRRRVGLVVVLGLVACVVVLITAVRLRETLLHGASLVECGSHASFVIVALKVHFQSHGWFPVPDDSRTTGFDALPVLDEVFWNCPVNAPSQRGGGRQMLLVGLADWPRIFSAFEGRDIPLVWCARAHGSWFLSPRRRVVIDLPAHDRPRLQAQYKKVMAKDPSAFGSSAVTLSIPGVMSEKEFQEAMARLRSIGLPASVFD